MNSTSTNEAHLRVARKALLAAARRGQVAKVAALLAAKGDIEGSDEVCGHCDERCTHCRPVCPCCRQCRCNNNVLQDGRTAMHIAAMKGHANVLQTLLGAGMSADAHDNVSDPQNSPSLLLADLLGAQQSLTPLHYATAAKNQEAVAVLEGSSALASPTESESSELETSSVDSTVQSSIWSSNQSDSTASSRRRQLPRTQQPAFTASPMKRAQRTAAEIMRLADAINRNGTLSVSEMGVFLQGTAHEGLSNWLNEQRQRRFKLYDANGDGGLQLAELIQAVLAYQVTLL